MKKQIYYYISSLFLFLGSFLFLSPLYAETITVSCSEMIAVAQKDLITISCPDQVTISSESETAEPTSSESELFPTREIVFEVSNKNRFRSGARLYFKINNNLKIYNKEQSIPYGDNTTITISIPVDPENPIIDFDIYVSHSRDCIVGCSSAALSLLRLDTDTLANRHIIGEITMWHRSDSDPEYFMSDDIFPPAFNKIEWKISE